MCYGVRNVNTTSYCLLGLSIGGIYAHSTYIHSAYGVRGGGGLCDYFRRVRVAYIVSKYVHNKFLVEVGFQLACCFVPLSFVYLHGYSTMPMEWVGSSLAPGHINPRPSI